MDGKALLGKEVNVSWAFVSGDMGEGRRGGEGGGGGDNKHARVFFQGRLAVAPAYLFGENGTVGPTR